MRSVETPLVHGPERSFLEGLLDPYKSSRFDKNRWQRLLDGHDNHRSPDNWRTASEVATMVRKTFQWGDINDYRVQDLDPARIDSMSNRMSCHGYTIVASECLEWLGVDHEIGLVDNHSLIFVTGNDESKKYLISFPNDWMDGDVSNHLKQTKEGKTLLDTGTILSQKDRKSYLSCVKGLPWVTNELAEDASRFLIDVDVFSSEWGREIIRHRFNQRWHSVRGNSGKAALSLARLNAARPSDDRQPQLVA